jgi:hypothetical protein
VNRVRSSVGRAVHPALPFLAAALLAASGCGKDSSGPTAPGPGSGTPSTTMAGLMINSAENGRLAVTIATDSLAPQPGAARARQVAVNASATYSPIGRPMVAMSGTYDTVTDSLYLSGGGYSIAALVETDEERPSMVGEYAGPNGPGFYGAVLSGVSAPVTLYCGTYESTATGPKSDEVEHGRLGFLVLESEFAGVMFSAVSPQIMTFFGAASGTGTVRTLDGSGGWEDELELAISGTLNTGTGAASGVWESTHTGTAATDQGTWSATPCP